MIPKIIHYCWLSGDPIPDDLKKYMDTWKKILPDYEFVLWDTHRFDIHSSLWVKQAFEQKKYAFAADYIRLYALYNYGGIYLDMDVEVIKSYNPLLDADVMVGFDHGPHQTFEMATIGTAKGMKFLKVLLDYYEGRAFIKEDGTFEQEPMPAIVMRRLKEKGFSFIPVANIQEAQKVRGEQSIPIYPRGWFSPLDWYTYKLHLTKDTYSIHRHKGTWLAEEIRSEREWLRKLGPFGTSVYRKIKNLFFNN